VRAVIKRLAIVAFFLVASCGESNGPGSTATRLVFAVQPSTVEAGKVIAPAVRVTAQDDHGNTVASSTAQVTLAIGSGSAGAVLGGTLTRTAVAGVASFDDVTIDKAGSGYTLIASALGLSAAISARFTISQEPPVPTRLAFAVEPGRTEPGDTILPGPKVQIQDQYGQPFATDTFTITLALGVNTSGATLTGTTTLQARAGVATFNDLRIDQAGNADTLVATSPGLASAATAIDVGLVLTSLSAGGRHTCGVRASGAAYCWGDNSSGQLGEGTINQHTTPTLVAGNLQFVDLSAGYEYTCGVTTGGAAYCWGINDEGQLGDSTNTPRYLPTPVVGGLAFTQVSAGYDHTCGITTTGVAYCWGRNDLGQLGDSTTNPRPTPGPVAGGQIFKQISAKIHTCGITADSTVYCWGRDVEGQLGDGVPTYHRDSPTPVASQLKFLLVSTGDYHTCALSAGSVAYCWGEGWTSTPAAIGLTLVQLDAGDHHTCGVTASNVAYCWGDQNVYGQLGDGTTDAHLTPAPVTGALPFTRVNAGNVHTCGITARREAYCWGYNFLGGLGDGTTVTKYSPVRVLE